MKKSYLLAGLAGLFASVSVAAIQHSNPQTPMDVARSDAQSEYGKTFEPRAQKYFLENNVSSLNKCRVFDREGINHDGVFYIDRSGIVRMVYVTPADSFGTCVRTRLLGVRFPEPPVKIYHLHVQLENALKQKRAKE